MMLINFEDERFIRGFFGCSKPYDHIPLNLVMIYSRAECLGLNLWRYNDHEVEIIGQRFCDKKTQVEGVGAIALLQHILGCDRCHAVQELYLLGFELGYDAGS